MDDQTNKSNPRKNLLRCAKIANGKQQVKDHGKADVSALEKNKEVHKHRNFP